MEPIDPKIKEAWRRSIKERQVWPKTYEHVDVLADAFIHERAMRAKAEFLAACFRGHDLSWSVRSNWTGADWEAKVRKELES